MELVDGISHNPADMDPRKHVCMIKDRREAGFERRGGRKRERMENEKNRKRLRASLQVVLLLPRSARGGDGDIGTVGGPNDFSHHPWYTRVLGARRLLRTIG